MQLSICLLSTCVILAAGVLVHGGHHKICYNLCKGEHKHNDLPKCYFKCKGYPKPPKGRYNRKFPAEFSFYDGDRDNVVTFHELKAAFSAIEDLKKKKNGLKRVFRKADTDGNKRIDFDEFRAAPWDFEKRNDSCHIRRFRDYYIQAEEILWNYLPAGENLVDNNNDYLEDSLKKKANRIGSEYYKFVYKRYTDHTYTTEIKSPAYLGFVMEPIHAEEGDVLRIHLRNLVPEEISIHPHGAFYLKEDEGAHYLDNTNGTDKLDDRIPFGHTRTMTWHMLEEFAPAADDPPCICFGVHSHNHAEKEIFAGLLTLLISCKPGVLTDDDVHPRRQDVSAEKVLYYESIDEGHALPVVKNLDLCGNASECHRLYREGNDEAFMESLKKDSINGYMYGNMPNLTVCAGEKVAWYMFSLNAEIHAAEIHGHQFQVQHQRKSTIGIWSATFITAMTVSTTPGKWLISCMNLEHFRNGMSAYLNVKDCGHRLKDSPTNHKVTYYLAAEPVIWNYGPSGLNNFEGGSLTAPGTTSAKLFRHAPDRIGGTYKKCRFVEYTNRSFKKQVVREEYEDHLALLGPVLRAAVGDRIKVVLKNKCPFNVSLYMQGVKFEKDQDGLLEKEGVPGTEPDGKIVEPGQTGKYKFTVPMSVSPDDDDPPCTAYIYHSAVNIEKDVNTGLVGPVLICKRGKCDRYTGRQRNIDQEIFLLFADMDENFSWYLQENINTYIPGFTDIHNEDFVASNIMRSINGRSYANLKGLNICQGDMVAWHVLSMGANEALHGVKFNGNNILTGGVNRDAYVVVPGGTFTGLMYAENEGNWSVSCHNTDHFLHGVKAIYNVECCDDPVECKTDDPDSGITRHYYIAAVDRKWNYSPKTIQPMTGEDYSHPNSSQYNRVRTDSGFIGSEYNKALYVEFTDATFNVEKPRVPNLGILGPVIRCAVGDTVKVVFKNMASRKYSIHPHGLRYSKDHEGQHYKDGHTSPGDGVEPGDTFTYIWKVPKNAGPAKGGPNCQGSMYQSGVDPVKDLYTGLVGAMVICKPGGLHENNTRWDKIKREFFLLMMAWDENQSWYLQRNIDEYAPGDDQTSEEKIEANKYDAMNGLVYGNLEGLEMCESQYVAWYGFALGLSEDYHDIHFHGNTYIHRTNRAHRGDVTDVFPGTKETVIMFAYNRGKWLVHCHVGQHTEDGMIATYIVHGTDHPFCNI